MSICPAEENTDSAPTLNDAYRLQTFYYSTCDASPNQKLCYNSLDVEQHTVSRGKTLRNSICSAEAHYDTTQVLKNNHRLQNCSANETTPLHVYDAELKDSPQRHYEDTPHINETVREGNVIKFYYI